VNNTKGITIKKTSSWGKVPGRKEIYPFCGYERDDD
jgi:hypothetical protein